MIKPIINEVFADNGAHSHWELIDCNNGEILWSEQLATDGREELEKECYKFEMQALNNRREAEGLKVEITSLQSSLKEKDLIIYGIEEGSQQWKEEYDSARKVIEQLIEASGIVYTYGSRIEGTYQKFPELLKAAKEFLSKYQHL